MNNQMSVSCQSRTCLAAWKSGSQHIVTTRLSKRPQTKRRTPTPAKMAFAGENACESDILERRSFTAKYPDTDKAYTLAKHAREYKQDIHCRNEPLCKPPVGILSMGEPGNLF